MLGGTVRCEQKYYFWFGLGLVNGRAGFAHPMKFLQKPLRAISDGSRCGGGEHRIQEQEIWSSPMRVGCWRRVSPPPLEACEVFDGLSCFTRLYEACRISRKNKIFRIRSHFGSRFHFRILGFTSAFSHSGRSTVMPPKRRNNKWCGDTEEEASCKSHGRSSFRCIVAVRN